MSDYFGKEVFKLGFGLMRLPKLEDGATDIEQVKVMVDQFIEAGGTYFDTAYVYDGGNSERAMKEALVDRYPRESYTVATKLNARAAKDAEDAKNQFNVSLERTGLDYIDYYLLHAVQENNWRTYEEYGLWDYIKELKAEGKVRYIGFSFHDTPELLEQVLNAHPEVDFVQLQLNYADWYSPTVAAKGNYEVARKHGVSITVMEPVKGGGLANPVPAVREVLEAADPDASPASWAIRYVASMDGIITVLSGMSNIAQMEDNVSFMRDFKPLTDEEQEVIRKAQAAILSANEIPCTACHYCTEGCPMQIAIPEIFSAVNEFKRYHNGFQFGRSMGIATRSGGSPADCIGCGQCEGACPQHLPIIELLKECTELAAH